MIQPGLSLGAPEDAPPGPLPAITADAVARLLAGETVALRLGPATYDLHAAPVPLLAADAPVVHLGDDGSHPVARSEAVVLGGTLAGVFDHTVRLVVRPLDGVSGIVLAPTGVWLLSPLQDGGVAAQWFSSIRIEPFGEDGIWPPGMEETDGPPAQLPASAPVDGRLLLRIAFEVDHGYYVENENDWQDDILTIIAYFDAILDQMDVQAEISWLGAWTSPDPYTSHYVCDGYDKLVQFREYWEQHRDDVPRDVAHLATSHLRGNYKGCAFIRQVDTPWAYGVSFVRTREPTGGERTAHLHGAVLVAHEIGHNMDGRHERSLGVFGATGTCCIGPPYTIMNPFGTDAVLRYSELDEVYSPATGWELDNSGEMRLYLETRLGPA